MALACYFSALTSFVTCKTTKNYVRASPSGSHKNKSFVCLATKQTSQAETTSTRQSANYKPSIWSYEYLQSLKDDPVDQELKLRAKKLEEEVKSMITNENDGILIKLEVIDDIQRLGLGYKFEDEIKSVLSKCVLWQNNNEGTEKKNLHSIALCFRLLRQHGFEVSQDVFKCFMDGPKAKLCEDVRGMLSLHEASYYAFEGESLLDEARDFTKTHLNHFIESESIDDDNGLAEQVNHELSLPLCHKMQRLEARRYIEAYAKRSDGDRVILETAKLDFNMVQSTLRSDLKDMSRWWKQMGLSNKLSFTRDRLMECFFWTVGMVFEPQYSNLRKGLTKVTSLITVIDDIYDVYGTLEELEQFTDAVERWDINCLQNLPDYMRISYMALYNTVNELAYHSLKEHDQYILPYLTKAWSDMFKAFLQEKRWSLNKETPSFKEYHENGWVSVSGIVILVHTYFLMTQNNITNQGLESLKNCHDLLRWPSVIFRLCNDLGTSTAELERGETANSILCYMRDTGVSEKIARRNMRNMVEETWKKMNKDMASKNCPFEKPFVETILNLARIAQCTYENGDSHGAPDSSSENRVLSVLIHPIEYSS